MENSVQNKSLTNKTKASQAGTVTSLPAASPGDAVLSCSAGTVLVPQSSLALAAIASTSGSGVVKDTISLTLSTTSSAQLRNPSLEPAGLAGKRRGGGALLLNMSAACTTSYAVVTNAQRVVVGQLVGGALAVSGAGLQGQHVHLCFSADPTILQCAGKFPVLDLALLNTDRSDSAVIQQLTVSEAAGPQYCASSVPAPGPSQTYFPVRRSADVNPAAVVVLQFTFASISDPAKFDASLQMILKKAIIAGLPASAAVRTDSVKITSICSADGKNCAMPARRRLLAGGVIASTAVTTSAAGTVSDGSTAPSFAGGFLSS